MSVVGHMHQARLDSGHHLSMPKPSQSQSQSAPSARSHLVQRGPGPFISPPRTSQPRQPHQRSNLVRRAQPPVIVTPPPTSPQQSDDDEDDEINDDEEDLMKKQKLGCNSLRDALEEEVNRKKRKRGIVK